jgi:muramoyltetrapeptide carboxypeptidase
MILPPRLREGARVALVAPAGPVTAERVTTALERCARFGLDAVLGSHAQRNFAGYLAGTDDERAADLRWAFTDPTIDAVWALRGGYGTMRLLPRLDFAELTARPRAYIGFSDNTAVHLALHAHGIAPFHGPHAGGSSTDMSERVLRRVLWHAEPAGPLEPSAAAVVTLRGGVAEGALMGGNLSLLAAMCGTATPPRGAGSIFFVEDIGEAAYRLDRAWMQLLLSGALDNVAGVALGMFEDCGETDAQLELFYRLTEPLGVPTVAGLPISHGDENWTLPLGIRARLDASEPALSLLEAAVSE